MDPEKVGFSMFENYGSSEALQGGIQAAHGYEGPNGNTQDIGFEYLGTIPLGDTRDRSTIYRRGDHLILTGDPEIIAEMRETEGQCRSGIRVLRLGARDINVKSLVYAHDGKSPTTELHMTYGCEQGTDEIIFRGSNIVASPQFRNSPTGYFHQATIINPFELDTDLAVTFNRYGQVSSKSMDPTLMPTLVEKILGI